MTTFLAQNDAAETAAATVRLFDSLDMLARPDELLASLRLLHPGAAAGFLIIGLLILVRGLRLYKAAVLLTAFLAGLIGGHELGTLIGAPLITALCIAVLLAVFSWPMMRYSAAFSIGLVGAVIAANGWTAVTAHGDAAAVGNPQGFWVAAGIGFTLLGSLSFLMFNFTVVIFTSFHGAMLASLGGVSLLLHWPQVAPAVAQAFSGKPAVLPMIVTVLSCIGSVVQIQSGSPGKSPKKSTAPARPAAA